MSRIVIVTGLLAVISALSVAATPQRQESQRCMLSDFKVGQALLLKDLGTSYEITILLGQESPLGHTVVEVECDFVTLRDITGLRETRIPIYSLKSIVTLKVERNAD